MCTNLFTKSAQNLSLKSVHKFCQQDQQICQQLSLISSKVYILSAGICPQKNPRICKQFVTILETICHYSAFRSSQIHFVLSRIMSVHTSTVNLVIMVEIYLLDFSTKNKFKHQNNDLNSLEKSQKLRKISQICRSNLEIMVKIYFPEFFTENKS